MQFSNETSKLKSDYESAVYKIEKEAKKKVRELERENKALYRIISTLQHTIEKVFSWVADKFNVKDKEELKEDFENDTYISLDVEKQIARLDREDDWDLER